jgi:homoserine O-acetyltransferase
MPQIYPYVDTIYASHHNNIPFYTLGHTDVYKLIFYVYGDCSSCVAKISDFQDYVDRNSLLLKDVLCAVILYTENIEVLGYNLEKISNTLPLYIDTLKIFSSYNSAPFNESHIMLLNDSNKIIYSSIEANEIGVNHLAAIVGGSFGGIQVMEWAAGHPDEVDKAVMIASGAALNSQALAFDIVGRYAITLDPDWQGGDYYSSPAGGPKTGLAHARQVAHITYLSLALLNERFGRKQQQSWLDKGPEFLEKHAAKFGTTFAIESYLGYQAKKFLARFDANSYLQITYAMDRYDAAEKYGSLFEACKRITSKMLLISLSGDWLFSEQQSRDIVQEMLKLRKDVSYSHLDVKVGHDGFLTNIEELSKVLGAYMRGGDVPPVIREFHRRRYQPVMDMIKPSSHILDIGCGSGRLMNMLREEKNVTSVGVDIAFNKIVSSLKGAFDREGVPAYYKVYSLIAKAAGVKPTFYTENIYVGAMEHKIDAKRSIVSLMNYSDTIQEYTVGATVGYQVKKVLYGELNGKLNKNDAVIFEIEKY